LIPRNGFFNVYLHRIWRSDDDRALHDHMYVNASILLSGSYAEVRRDGGIRSFAERALIFRLPSTPHRLVVSHFCRQWNRPVVTLFVTGPRVRNWGFHCPRGWLPYERFVHPTDPGLVGPGCEG
jgi:hypothetical protein